VSGLYEPDSLKRWRCILQLDIAEIFYDSGELRYRYSRYLAKDGSTWIRHGRFTAYHRNGQLASEGNYVDGLEDGGWRDFHENGRIAAEGRYDQGQETADWQYWDANGILE
jgi:antitoxin component YwqK of YwqJK toxin-antitoxin module